MMVFVTTTVFFAAAQVWVEPSISRILPGNVPPPHASTFMRLYAAQGEYESFQVAIRAGDTPVEVQEVRLRGRDRGIAGCTVHRVGYLALPAMDADAPWDLWPDPLLDFAPMTVPPRETRSLWVTLAVAPEARAGTLREKLYVVLNGERPVAISAHIEVFRLCLPEIPSLGTSFALDRNAIRSFYGLDDRTPGQWEPFYTRLLRDRIAFPLWDGGDLVEIGADGRVDASNLKAHLECVGKGLSSIDLGPGLIGASLFPQASGQGTPDALQAYLNDMSRWLEGRGWKQKAFFEPTEVPERAEWLAALAALRRAGQDIRLLLVGEPRPYFDGAVTIWATPLRFSDPHVFRRIRDGAALASPSAAAPKSVRASSYAHLAGQEDYDRLPVDACDGSVFTFWLSDTASEPNRRQEWLELAFPAPVSAKVIRVVWRSGFEADIVETRIGRDAATLAPVSVEWKPFPPPGPHTQSWIEGTLPRFMDIGALRLTFAGGAVGVTEVLVGDHPEVVPPSGTRGTPWLCIAPREFPSFAVDAHPVQARLLPWMCYGHDAEGFVCYGLNQWPSDWRAVKDQPPMVWETDDPERLFLYYPGPHGLLPSVRSEALRDGMEDYELLKAAADQLASGKRLRDDAAPYAARRMYGANATPEEMEGFVRMILEGRVALGLALSQNVTGGVR